MDTKDNNDVLPDEEILIDSNNKRIKSITEQTTTIPPPIMERKQARFATYFIAFTLSPSVRASLQTLQNQLVMDNDIHHRARVEVSTFAHITLAVLQAPVSSEMDHRLLTCMRNALTTQHIHPFIASFYFLERFGNSVIYAKPELPSQANRLQILLSSQLKQDEITKQYLKIEDRKWIPHVTILKTKGLPSSSGNNSKSTMLSFDLTKYDTFFKTCTNNCLITSYTLFCTDIIVDEGIWPKPYRNCGEVHFIQQL
jgi:2'-5' RNA ligase